ncbi:MAG: hypothetical protein BWY35_01248 [Firmicutes bacterium ADurb.Bin248]|nr:MAG: hypothetical protein BWY35_01248 [Firmicutes bacterium ADurb.Bin248]HOF99736.1 DUF192 domain-containing protein [Clostridia bacterium]HPK16619.1 DUF192 domain-containing protein [Clostridia bacterium]
MRRVKAFSNGSFVAEADVAENFFTRLRGLMGKSPIRRALWIVPCSDIHTFNMREDIDVVFLSRQSEVLRIIEAMPKNRTSGKVRGAHSVLELPAHTLRSRNLLDISTIEFVREGHYGG